MTRKHKVSPKDKRKKTDMPSNKRARPKEGSESDSDDEISRICRGCSKKLSSLLWLKRHLDRSKTNCLDKYSKEEYQSIELKGVQKGKDKHINPLEVFYKILFLSIFGYFLVTFPGPGARQKRPAVPRA